MTAGLNLNRPIPPASTDAETGSNRPLTSTSASSLTPVSGRMRACKKLINGIESKGPEASTRANACAPGDAFVWNAWIRASDLLCGSIVGLTEYAGARAHTASTQAVPDVLASAHFASDSGRRPTTGIGTDLLADPAKLASMSHQAVFVSAALFWPPGRRHR